MNAVTLLLNWLCHILRELGEMSQMLILESKKIKGHDNIYVTRNQQTKIHGCIGPYYSAVVLPRFKQKVFFSVFPINLNK